MGNKQYKNGDPLDGDLNQSNNIFIEEILDCNLMTAVRTFQYLKSPHLKVQF